MLLLYKSMLENENTRIQFERIYRKYYDGVHRRIYKILKNKQDTEDISQETWLKVVKHYTILEKKGEATVIAYIMRIAKNESISLIRRRQKEAQYMTHSDIQNVLCEEDFFSVLEHHTEEAIIDCIKSLDAAYSDALVYHYLYHLPIEAISELLEISEDAARKRISRGRAKLAALLNREGII